jgi:hypothetical protein
VSSRQLFEKRTIPLSLSASPPSSQNASIIKAREKKRPSQTGMELTLVYQPAKASTPTRAVAPGVRALAWQEFVAER